MPQSLVKTYIHLVFSTKGRTELLPKQHLEEVHAYVAQIMNNHECPALTVGGTANHIHILFILSRSTALSDIVRIVKSNSSKWINERTSGYKFAWQDGYGAFSISQSHVEAVKAYIANQAQHHQKIRFEDELRKLCNIYGIAINEKYVWD